MRKVLYKKRFAKKASKLALKCYKYVTDILNKTNADSECLKVGALTENDRIFTDSNGITDPWLRGNRSFTEIALPRSYMNTALDLLSFSNMANDNLTKDGYLYPALFCFRQYLELTMKDSIHYFKVYRGETSDSLLGYDGVHSLKDMWNSLSFYLEESEDNIIVEKLIYDFHKIDPTSTRFRYSYGVEKNLITQKKELIVPYNDVGFINVVNLRNVMLKLYRYFESINEKSRKRDETYNNN